MENYIKYALGVLLIGMGIYSYVQWPVLLSNLLNVLGGFIGLIVIGLGIYFIRIANKD
ncbi:hypothetical protein J4403_03125 [Candidatus Woesearchaeota archaeon]|nr:hypothetical protein [Candidatus Woesearchaeota archaeon]